MDHARVLGKWAAGSSAAVAGAALMSTASHAASATGSFQVRLEILNSCEFSTASAADLAALPSTAGSSTVGWIDVSCTEKTPYYIELSAMNGEADSAHRSARVARLGADGVQPHVAQTALPSANRPPRAAGQTVKVTVHY